MKKRSVLLLVLALCVLLCGCDGWRAGSFVSITPHTEAYSQAEPEQTENADSYDQMIALLVQFVQNRTEQATVDVSRYKGELEKHLPRIIRQVKSTDPLTAYAVREITVDIAEVGVRRMASVQIQYSRSAYQMQNIESAWGAVGIENKVHTALSQAQTSLTLQVKDYEEVNLTEIVSRYYETNLDTVMECPTVTHTAYPNYGSTRILDISFNYTLPRQSLLDMAGEVKLMLSSASGYVRGQDTELAKAERLNSFLRPLFAETGTSPTPVYSLLYQGIGDSHSIATVFGLLCEEVGLTCQVVSGTKNGEVYYWNILDLDGLHYHADLHSSWLSGQPLLRFDDEMTDCQWNTELYPPCPRPEIPVTEPTEEPLPTEAAEATEAALP